MTKVLQRLFPVMVMLVAGCTVFRSEAPPEKANKPTTIRRANGKSTGPINANVLSAEVGRFADEYTVLVAQAADDFAEKVKTAEARSIALSWKAGVASTTMIIATGPNPTANLLDMVVLVTLQRITFEEYWVPRFGKPAEGVLAVSRELETDIWELAGRILTKQQEDELRELIREWREKHPEQVYITVRFRDFAELSSVADPKSNSKIGSLFSLSFLDPFAGLDPTTRELAQSRFFAERALYVLERMPKLLRWQSELLVAQTIATPEVQQLVTNSTQFSQSASQLANSIEKFPDQLAGQTPQLQALSAQLQQTFTSGRQMADSVDAAVQSLDAFIQRVTPPPSTNVTATPGKPFDVTEYGAAAAEVGKAAQQLDTLTHSLEKTTPEIGTVVDRTGLRGKELVDYAFHKALLLLVLLLTGAIVVMLVQRLLRKPKGNNP